MVSLARVAWEVARKVGKNSEVARKVAHLLGRFMVPVSQFPISVIAIVRVCFLISSEVGSLGSGRAGRLLGRSGRTGSLLGRLLICSGRIGSWRF